jgi:hypothetical protein
MPANRSDWERVGKQLAERRVQISARYANRRAFAEDVGMNWRTLYDAEYGKRATFRQETVRAIENAYRLVPGSLARSLAGGPLEADPAPRAAGAPAALGAPAGRHDNDPKDDTAAELFRGDTTRAQLLRLIWRYSEDPDKRLELIEVVDPKLAAALRDVAAGRQSEAGLGCTLQTHVQRNDSATSGVFGNHRTLAARHP